MKDLNEDDLLAALSTMTGSVLTVGDIMLDVFTYGTATRISPEAPVPVMRRTGETRMLGGAGNVARNIAALNGISMLSGPIGRDMPGDVIVRLLDMEDRIQNHLMRVDGRQTITKERFVVAGQQMLRVDREDTAFLPDPEATRLLDKTLELLPNVSAVVLSDYGKGALPRPVLAAIIDAARKAGTPVFVDPKHVDMTRYAGATCITPNAAELAAATHMPTDLDDEVEAASRVILKETGAAFLLVTRSAYGLSLVPNDGATAHIRARSRPVFDVSGAGDTVIAALALAVGSGIDWLVAARLANIAAGIVVSKPGTATCSLDEIELELFENMLSLGTKLQLGPKAADLAERWKRKGLRVGFTNGCFDLLHPGHVSLLQRARQRCDRLIVGLNADASVTRLKGIARPLQSHASRATVLAALNCVDLVVVFEEDTPIELIRCLNPTILFKGSDYKIEDVVGGDHVAANGGRVELIDVIPGQSTTNIVNRMR